MRRSRTPVRTALVLGTLLTTGGFTLLQAPEQSVAASAPDARADVAPRPTSAARAEALKKAIVLIAERAKGTCDEDDNDPAVTRVLNRLTDKLVRAVPARTESEKLPQVAGGWKLVWSDLEVSGQGGEPVCTSTDGVYQVVSPNNYYWNIFTARPPGGEASTGFLRGKYETTPNRLKIEFTELAVSPSVPPPGTDLVDLADRAENGEFIPLPPGNGVGVTGELRNEYVDDEVRIVRGSDDRPGNPESIFVLVRADVVD